MSLVFKKPINDHRDAWAKQLIKSKVSLRPPQIETKKRTACTREN